MLQRKCITKSRLNVLLINKYRKQKTKWQFNQY